MCSIFYRKITNTHFCTLADLRQKDEDKSTFDYKVLFLKTLVSNILFSDIFGELECNN